jgi:hypothetical protein
MNSGLTPMGLERLLDTGEAIRGFVRQFSPPAALDNAVIELERQGYADEEIPLEIAREFPPELEPASPSGERLPR